MVFIASSDRHSMNELDSITVRGAREHNLKSIDVKIPRNKLVVFTGISGSGKSSLAMDTIYAEGQRRYVESLSAYARQFLNMMEKPDIDSISGLSPAISIEQKTTSRNPRSTVGTITEIYDYLRLLFARTGTPHSPATGLPIAAQQVSDMAAQLLKLKDGTRVNLLAPVVRDRKGEYRKEFQEFRKHGFLRVKVDGILYELDDPPKLEKNKRHDIDLLVDRVVIKSGINNRLADSIRTALDQANGIMVAETVEGDGRRDSITFSENFSCPVSGFTIHELEPRLFSFNAPYGACPDCDGLGKEVFFDEKLIIPDPTKNFAYEAIRPWAKSSSVYHEQTIDGLAQHYGVNAFTPWAMLPTKFKNLVLYGSDGEEINFTYYDDKRSYNVKRSFEGVIPNMERRYRETDSNYVREEFERYQGNRKCKICDGYRLKQEALAVKLANLHIAEVTELSIVQAHEWIQSIPDNLSSQANKVAASILKEIDDRLSFLLNVGLGYLTLARASGSLSGGESQRIRLASQIGAGLSGVLYVLDEPSIGLHQRDNKKLLSTLKGLRDQGNSVLVVEHDEEAIREADHVLDFGPGAGIRGGEIVAQGSPDDIQAASNSLTGQYLSGRRKILIPESRRQGNGTFVEICGAHGNNLKDISARFPLCKLICVTGVSGSGKSTLTFDTLYEHAAASFGRRPAPNNCLYVKGLAENLNKVIDIDQRPIGRTPRSNPATYVDMFTPIRNWFTNLPESKKRGYKPGRFSFNVKGGRCEACEGDGVLRIAMHFLSDVYVKCESCNGARYNKETLEIKFRGKNIADVLDMTVDVATKFFEPIPAIRQKLVPLQRVGLGYIKLGQSATTLSGGEAQRVKLAKELSKRSTGQTLYILDEPTTGLHFDDIQKLLSVLHEFVDQGNTVVVIEHNLDVIKTADWIIDLGPEGGDGGGEVLVCGTPEDVVACPHSFTGHYLAAMLPRQVVAAE